MTPSGPARRWAAAAGAPGYEWSGAGLEPASGDSWEEAGFLRAEGEGELSDRVYNYPEGLGEVLYREQFDFNAEPPWEPS
ncbi:hypothetical protein U0070_003561 [Myodes glareolus]|uniref:Uncharacterized protein n=1 Tax=Myodes glareolus TaxID=447135 RepID=A0AAW0J0J1_MYOGA